jgi:hypothetical protein
MMVRKTIDTLILLMLVTLVSFCCQEERISYLVSKLVSSEPVDTILEEKIDKFGTKSIPILIDSIDVDVQGFVGYGDPLSSNLYPFAYTYTGCRAAYMIEYILNGSKRKVYPKCRIGKNDRSPMTLMDMKEVKRIYSSWWQANIHCQLQELRLSYKNKPPLSGSKYVWF